MQTKPSCAAIEAGTVVVSRQNPDKVEKMLYYCASLLISLAILPAHNERGERIELSRNAQLLQLSKLRHVRMTRNMK